MADASAPSLFYNLYCWEPFIMPGKAPPPDPVVESIASRDEAIEVLKQHQSKVGKDDMELYYLATPNGLKIWLDKNTSQPVEGTEVFVPLPAP